MRGWGTFSNLPVLYLAIGRRLGYPLYLASAKGHLFIRWEDADERFNVECTMQGFVARDDEYYRGFPFPITDEEVARGAYLQNLSRREELAAFIAERGSCLSDRLHLDAALSAAYHAAQIDHRYDGNWAVATKMRDIFINLRRHRIVSKEELPALIDACSPPANTRIDRWAFTKAKEELIRLLRVPEQAALYSTDQSFATWEGDQADLFRSLNKKPRSSRCTIRP